MVTDLHFKKPSDKDVWAVLLLVNQAAGPSEQFEAEPKIKENLGDEGILIYKTIFDRNKEETRDKFLLDKLISKSLWPVFQQVPIELCFKNGEVKDKMVATYREMTRIVEGSYELKMPAWWSSAFPASKL